MYKRVLMFSLLLFTSVAYSQNMQIRTYTPTPRGNVYYNQTVRIPYYYNSGNYTSNSIKGEYIVRFPNDSIVKVQSKVEHSDSTYFLKVKNENGESIIRPNETKVIKFVNPSKIAFIGIPTDTCWLFYTSTNNKINVYTSVPVLNFKYCIAIQKGEDGEIVPFRKDALIEMVKDNPEALNYIREDNFHKAIQRYNEKK